MQYAEALLPIIDRVYAAAAREVALEEAFLAFAKLMGDFSLAMWVHDPVVGHTKVGAGVGVERHWLEKYDARWSERNPLVQRSLPDLLAGKIVNSDDIMPWESLQETDYYKEFLRPMGMRYSLAGLVSGSGQCYASLVTTRAEAAGPYQPWHIDLLHAIRPHIARALHILEYFEGARVNLEAYHATMDRLPFSVLLVDNHRNILHANASARRRLKQADGIADAQGRLEASGRAGARFRQDWAALVDSDLSSDGQFALETTDGVLPMEASRILVSGAAINANRLWMLRLFDQRLDASRLAEHWAMRFQFTPAQCKTGLALIEHTDVQMASRSLGISIETLRSHLKAMFDKTGARTQAALVLRLTA